MGVNMRVTGYQLIAYRFYHIAYFKLSLLFPYPAVKNNMKQKVAKFFSVTSKLDEDRRVRLFMDAPAESPTTTYSSVMSSSRQRATPAVFSS